jgi:hypothetical protein
MVHNHHSGANDDGQMSGVVPSLAEDKLSGLHHNIGFCRYCVNVCVCFLKRGKSFTYFIN